MEVYEFDEDIRVCVSRREKNEDPRTTREVESALRRAEVLRTEHQKRAAGVPAGPPPKRSAVEPKPLSARLLSSVVARTMATPPPPQPAPTPPPAPPVLAEDDDEEEKGIKRQMPMERRIPLQVRVHSMVVREEMSNSDVADMLNNEGTFTANGEPWNAGRVSVFVRQHQKLLDLLGSAAPRPRRAQSSLPPYLTTLLKEPSLTFEQKTAALRALCPKLPTSVGLMMEDPDLTSEQKLEILAVVGIKKEGA